LVDRGDKIQVAGIGCFLTCNQIRERNRLAIALERSAERRDQSLARALAAARTAEGNRGRDVVVLDLRDLTTMCDFFVLATGTSRRQLHAISEEIDDVLHRDFHDKRLGIEGYAESRWILLDYGDVVVHLFDAETRDYYSLEQLWTGCHRVPMEPMPEAPLRQAK
jgi:ribosome-associated protein